LCNRISAAASISQGEGFASSLGPFLCLPGPLAEL
jgi:hypothetical protein